jgi:hypothetical protein
VICIRTDMLICFRPLSIFAFYWAVIPIVGFASFSLLSLPDTQWSHYIYNHKRVFSIKYSVLLLQIYSTYPFRRCLVWQVPGHSLSLDLYLPYRIPHVSVFPTTACSQLPTSPDSVFPSTASGSLESSYQRISVSKNTEAPRS